MTEATTSAGIDGRPRPRKQVLEHLVGKQIVAVIGQERLDAPFGNQLAAQSGGVEQLRVGFASSLHLPILDDPGSNREYSRAIFQQSPRRARLQRP